jgi:hypothetical protein
MTTSTDRDPTLTAAYWGVAVTAVVSGGIGLAVYGFSVASGVMLGGLIAFSNLWVHARVVKMYLAGGGRVWAVVGLIKVSLLFGFIYVLVQRDLVGLVPLIAGYGALPVGILAAHLRPAPAPATEEG